MTLHQTKAKRIRRHRRLRKKVSGSPHRPRLAVFRSNRYIYAQLIDDVSGKTLASASSLEPELRKAPHTAETASQVGKLMAERASGAGFKKVVLDRGGFLFSGKVKALAEAARKGGLEF